MLLFGGSIFILPMMLPLPVAAQIACNLHDALTGTNPQERHTEARQISHTHKAVDLPAGSPASQGASRGGTLACTIQQAVPQIEVVAALLHADDLQPGSGLRKELRA